MNKFIRDLYNSETAEQIVIDIFNSCDDLNSYIVTKTCKVTYDIVTSGILSFTTEVKNDAMEQYTGNIAIEYYNSVSKNCSGILFTHSDLWVEVLCPSFVWITSTKSLKKYIKDNKPERIIKKAGDGNADIMLYKSSIILPAIFSRIDNVGPQQVFNVLQDLLYA